MNLLLIRSRELLYKSRMPEARAQLGEEAFDAAWQKGQRMKPEEAIEYALALPDG